jgi:hypothetical protein
MITLGPKVGAMLYSAFRFWGPGAGVLQLAGTIVVGGVLALSSQASAQDRQVCAEQSSQASEAPATDGEGWACGEVLPELDLTLPSSNAAAVGSKSKDKPAVLPAETPANAPLPVEITPSDTGARARASLQSLRNFESQTQARKLQEASTASGAALAVPKAPILPATPLDVWTQFDAQGFDASDARTLKSGAGLDYRVVKNASVGVAAERSESVPEGPVAAGSLDEKVSAYVAFRALPAVTIDARGNWERAETADPAAAGPGEKTSVVVAPRFSKSYALEGGETIAPYLEVKREIDLGVSGLAADQAGATNSAAAGVTLSKQNGYAVSVSADVSDAKRGEDTSISSKVQLKLPLE